MYEYDPKKFDDSQVFDDLKEISIGSMDFDNPKVCGDASISDGLVFLRKKSQSFLRLLNFYSSFCWDEGNPHIPPPQH